MAAFAIFSSSNFALTLFASLITAFIAPECAGSGIPEVKAYLNGVDAPAIFSLRTLLVKVIMISTKFVCISSVHLFYTSFPSYVAYFEQFPV